MPMERFQESIFRGQCMDQHAITISGQWTSDSARNEQLVDDT